MSQDETPRRRLRAIIEVEVGGGEVRVLPVVDTMPIANCFSKPCGFTSLKMKNVESIRLFGGACSESTSSPCAAEVAAFPIALSRLPLILKMLGIEEEPRGKEALKGRMDHETDKRPVTSKYQLFDTHTTSKSKAHEKENNIMSNIDTAFPSRYLKASDLNGERVSMKIENVTEETVGKDNEIKWVLHFHQQKKGLILNKTNATTIAKIAGSSEFEDWVDTQVVLVSKLVQFGGDEVDAIRIETPKRNVRKLTPAADNKDSDSSDNIPF